MSYNFKFGGTWLSDLYAVCTKRPPREVAQYDFTLLDIPGKSGSEYIDNKRYKNVPFTRQIGFVDRPNSVVTDFDGQLISWLAYNQGYREFEDTDHPDLVTYAALTNFAEVQTVLRRHHKATLRFSRVPFWFSKSGLETSTTDTPSTGLTLTNPYPIESLPLIEVVLVSGGGAVLSDTDSFTLYYKYPINGVTRTFTQTYTIGELRANTIINHVFFDVENQQVYSRTNAGYNTKYTSVLVPPSFVASEETTVKISAQSGNSGNVVARIKVTPKWRCL